MSKLYDSPLMVLVYGTTAALVLFIAVYSVMDREQCPTYHSQAQVDQSGCIIGANMGLGLAYLLGLVIWLVSLVVALMILRRRKKKN